jgi:hypothetical protein
MRRRGQRSLMMPRLAPLQIFLPFIRYILKLSPWEENPGVDALQKPFWTGDFHIFGFANFGGD